MTTTTELHPVQVGTDKSDFAHIVTKDDQMKGYILGAEIQALCGYIWVPSKDFANLPVCPDCVHIREQIQQRNQN